MRQIAGKILKQQQQFKIAAANKAAKSPTKVPESPSPSKLQGNRDSAFMQNAGNTGQQLNNLNNCLTQTPKNLNDASGQKFSKIQLQAIIDNMYTHEGGSGKKIT